MGDRLVEKAADVVALTAKDNQVFEKTFVHVILSCSHEQRVKI